MLNHTKACVEKIHSIDAERPGHAHKLDVKLQRMCQCVGVAFLCLLCACLPSLTTMKWTDQQHFALNKNGVHFFTLNFECHNRYYRLFL